MEAIYFILSFCASVQIIYAFSFDRTFQLSSHRSRRVTDEAAGEPLFLTPFIDAGNFSDAKEQSRVKPPLLDGVNSYTGFLTVNKTAKSHLYFWFIPKTSDEVNAPNDVTTPLIIWLQGGPGGSSLYGLFTENGPFRVNRKGLLEKRQYAWTEHYHMLYIDQPVGTGFSFTQNDDGYATSEFTVARHLYEALEQFYKIFPDFRDNDLYLAGESYAGKYIPALGYKIHTANRQRNASIVSLKGMMIGNGISDPESMQEYDTQLRALGLIDEEERLSLRKTEDVIRYLIRSGQFSQAANQKYSLRRHIKYKIGFSTLYDYTRADFQIDESYVQYLSDSDIRKRIHVGSQRYEIVSETVGDELENDIMQTVRPWIETLLEHYPILFYNGQFDMIAAHSATENFLSRLHWSGAFEYGQTQQQKWLVDNSSVAGYYKSAHNLVYVMVRNAGHMVPADQPKNALTLIDMFIEKKFKELLKISLIRVQR